MERWCLEEAPYDIGSLYQQPATMMRWAQADAVEKRRRRYMTPATASSKAAGERLRLPPRLRRRWQRTRCRQAPRGAASERLSAAKRGDHQNAAKRGEGTAQRGERPSAAKRGEGAATRGERQRGAASRWAARARVRSREKGNPSRGWVGGLSRCTRLGGGAGRQMMPVQSTCTRLTWKV